MIIIDLPTYLFALIIISILSAGIIIGIGISSLFIKAELNITKKQE